MTDIVSPTPIAALPPAPQPTDTPAEFNTKGFATVAAQVAMIPQINTAAAQTNQNATAANERAVASAESAGQAQGFRDEAEGFRNTTQGYRDQTLTYRNDAEGFSNTTKNYRDQAQGFRNEAEGFRNTTQGYRDQTLTYRNDTEGLRNAAQGFRDQAEVFATQQIKGSSTTSVTPGAGAKTFAIEASRSFVTGMYVVATSTSDPATQMSGPVQSYNPTTGGLIIAVDMFSGASARADWVIGVAAPGAATGLARQVVTANTTCVAGVAYIVAAAGITLTLPTAWVAGDKIAIIEAIGDWQQYSIVWGTTRVRTQLLGTQLIDAMFADTGVLTYQDATRGLI